MTVKEMLNKYCELLDKGYCYDCNELNCITNGNIKLISKAIRELLQEKEKLKQALIDIKEYVKGAYEMGIYTKSVSLEEENIEDILYMIDKVLGGSDEQ